MADESEAPTVPAASVPVWPLPEQHASGAGIIPRQLARLAWLCTVTSGLILLGVLAGNALLLLQGIAPTLWLIALVDIGPLIALFTGNVATILGYYGTWRILRRLDEYSARDDAKNQVLQAPGLLQDVPRELSRRFGCLHVLTLGTLAVSLVVTGLTLAPPPLRALGVAVVVAAPTPTPTPIPTALPTATATAAPTINLQVNPIAAQQQCAPDGTLQPLNVTLDNTGSAVAVGWSVTLSDTVPNTSLIWASANPSAGSVAAGASDAFALAPTARLCAAANQPTAYTATVALDNGALAPVTITDTIVPPAAPAVFAVTQNQDAQQTCVHGATVYVPSYTVTLSNQLNTAVTWSIGQFDLNVNGAPWATANPLRGTLAPGTTSSVTIAPSTVACQITSTTTWHAQVTTSQGTTIPITDTVTP